jgi:regulator of protease activity HflC (stomatin/prohibitin superfamily)
MTAQQQVPQAVFVSPDSRNLNNVQRVQRTLIWFALFIVISVLTITVGIITLGIAEPLGGIVFSVGGLIALTFPGMVSRCLYIASEYERVVVLKLGKFQGVRGPGRFWVIPYPPFNESVAMILDIRTQTRVITAAETLTSDNVPVGCEAVIFSRVEDPQKAALSVTNYREAVFQAANSALKDTIGMLELTELLGSRDKVSGRLKEIIDSAAASFGIDVTSVEITDVRVPNDLIQELSVLAQSRRSAQAKIAEAEAEKAIAQQFNEAAELMSERAMEIYRLSVLERIGREEGSQIIVYGLNAVNPALEQTVAATAAAARTK